MTIIRFTIPALLALALLTACGRKGEITDLRPPPPAEQPTQGSGG